MLDYDEAAARQFTLLRGLRLSVGTMDLKIASIALSVRGILLTCNTKDFARVPSLKVEDWTRPNPQARIPL
jgi:tRNA(fMet)-specific endonuclease VapC